MITPLFLPLTLESEEEGAIVPKLIEAGISCIITKHIYMRNRKSISFPQRIPSLMV
jgi:hypothetical protein